MCCFIRAIGCQRSPSVPTWTCASERLQRAKSRQERRDLEVLESLKSRSRRKGYRKVLLKSIQETSRKSDRAIPKPVALSQAPLPLCSGQLQVLWWSTMTSNLAETSLLVCRRDFHDSNTQQWISLRCSAVIGMTMHLCCEKALLPQGQGPRPSGDNSVPKIKGFWSVFLLPDLLISQEFSRSPQSQFLCIKGSGV